MNDLIVVLSLVTVFVGMLILLFRANIFWISLALAAMQAGVLALLFVFYNVTNLQINIIEFVPFVALVGMEILFSIIFCLFYFRSTGYWKVDGDQDVAHD